jgi:2-keto-3-deoxy-L-rhamnonate aldolase RhmA
VLRAAKAVGKVPGKHCTSAADVSQRIAEGFQFLALSNDAALMQKAAREAFGAVDYGG